MSTSSESESFGLSYLVKGQLWYLEQVQNKLGALNMDYLHRSCLGHLFQIANIKVQAPLLVVMLKNLEGNSLKRRTLSFRFNSRSIEFNREDFALMTGLKYGMMTDLTAKRSEIHSTVFSNQTRITFEDINNAFFSECAKNGGSSELSLKLALLYIVYRFFLIRDKAANDIDLKYLHLVDDVEAFIQYPWGQVAYNFLVKEMHSAAEKIVAEDHDLRFNGFTAALQLWVYEVFPNVGRTFGNKLTWRLESFPRMLVWGSSRCPPIHRVEPHFTQIGGIEMVYIVMSPSERAGVQALYVVAAKTTPNTVPVAKAKSKLCRKLDYKQAASVEFVSERPPVPMPVQKPDVRKVEILPNKNHVTRTATKKRVRKIPTARVTEQIEGLKKVQGFTNNVTRAATKKRVKQIPAATVITINSTSTSNAKMEKPNDGDSNLDLKLNEIFVTLTELRDCCQSNSVLLQELKRNSENQGVHAPHSRGHDPLKTTKGEAKLFCPMKWKAPIFSKHVVGNESKTSSGSMHSALKEENAVAKAYMYDPTESSASDEDIQGFILWQESAGRMDQIELPSSMVRHVTKMWFDDIWDRELQLCNDHIDALTSLLLLKKSEKPDAFMDRWTMIEMICWPMLTSKNLDHDIELLRPYVRGSYPGVGGLPWEDVDLVYGIGHVLGNHWVAYECNFLEQPIVIYDPLSDSGAKNAVVEKNTCFSIERFDVVNNGEDLDCKDVAGKEELFEAVGEKIEKDEGDFV